MFRTTVTGTDKLLAAHTNAAGKILVTANHVSLIDGVLIALSSPIPLVFAVAPEYALRRSITRHSLMLLSRMGYGQVVPLDTTSCYGVRALYRELEQGNAVMIFPEGRIRAGAESLELMPGVNWLLHKTGAAEVKVSIRGPEQSRLFSRTGRKYWPATALHYGDY